MIFIQEICKLFGQFATYWSLFGNWMLSLFSDNIVDIYNLTDEQTDMLNECSEQYGMKGRDYEE